MRAQRACLPRSGWQNGHASSGNGSGPSTTFRGGAPAIPRVQASVRPDRPPGSAPDPIELPPPCLHLEESQEDTRPYRKQVLGMRVDRRVCGLEILRR